MDRRITLRKGSIVSYLGHKYDVIDVYPYIAYLKDVDKAANVICVCVGDLVMAGIQCLGQARPEYFGTEVVKTQAKKAVDERKLKAALDAI